MRIMRVKGFTLVEMMLSAAILVMVLGAFLYSINLSSTAAQQARLVDVALSAAQAKMEEISNRSFTAGEIANIIADYNGQYFAVSGLTAPSGTAGPLGVTITQIGSSSLYRVVITVSWQQSGGKAISKSIEKTFVLK